MPLATLSFPLIPANAGTQIKGCKRWVVDALAATLAQVQPYNLGPGMRRDERIKSIASGSR